MDEHSENFNKEIENIRKYHTDVIEPKDTITKLKKLKGFNAAWMK